MKTLIAVLTAASAAGPLSAQSAELQRQLVAARDTVWRAWYSGDTTLLHRFLPPALSTLGGGKDPRWADRRVVIDDSRGFARSKAKLIDLHFDNTEIAQTGQTALVRADYRTIVETGGKIDTSRGQATELFVRQGNTWINPYWQLEARGPGQPDAGRAIILPDTLGANFSIADSAAAMGTAADYDALVGTWEFRFQNRRADGTFNPPFTGHWTFEKKTGGGLVEDRWRPDDPSIPMAISLYTYRTFDQDRKVWQMHGTHAYGGEVQPGLTWGDGKNRYAIQRSHGVLTRIRYLSFDPNHFLWRSDRSNDGGKTWLLDNGTMEARRIGK